ncbi:hypothetical protein DFR86_08135 [Acidianus sulfidivorans JP7]|uniref:Uncharacterized protein n=1 Tax=Acidianus sulfidivorans JP7 TaxID=619593 RepID=A0A2U9INE6_9CREN|nr:hypothetical protein [Acidianus sulfidivorans]AWR97522.1 hypothetical protein DFR86_08135 [Acidianus sulfidivorans JP7]
MKIKIWKEWYDIISKISETKRKDINDTINYILQTNECLNLSKIKTSKLKEINITAINKQLSPEDIYRKIEKFLFCD